MSGDATTGVMLMRDCSIIMVNGRTIVVNTDTRAAAIGSSWQAIILGIRRPACQID